ncbi:MAG TPA: 23S rRNA (uracil(1939)-C(5))-methyltransferase RlmD [Clostridia bacterium]|nr:23S rRNA (uracil(1939)-C(5))-methyltransferase RlmD [Clostridia bacterium]
MIFGGTTPVKGEVVDIEIDNLAFGGEGVGRCRGMAVFVPETVPGERVRVKLTEVKKTFARGELVRVLTPAEGRVDYQCDLASRCGGCALQHIDYPRQLVEKANIVRDNLERTGRLKGIDVPTTVGMETPWNYRNKVHFQVKEKDGRIILGLFEEGTHDLVELFTSENGDTGCFLVEKELNLIAPIIQEMLDEYNVPVYKWREKKGFLRHVMLRRATATGEIMAVLVANSPDWKSGEGFAKDLVGRCPDIKSVMLNVNRHHGRVVLGTHNIVLAGRGYITDRLLGLDFRITPSSFYQVNHAQTEVLYKQAREFAGLTGKERVLDLYCGIGGIALHLASAARSVVGVEIVGEAVETARVNAAINGINNVEFIAGDIEKIIAKPTGRKELGNSDVVVLDPPRKGCSRTVLKGLSIFRPDRIVYVSCNPSTLARDLAYLTELGYSTAAVQPIDLFPHTSHVETVVLMSRVDK